LLHDKDFIEKLVFFFIDFDVSAALLLGSNATDLVFCLVNTELFKKEALEIPTLS